MSFCCFLMCNFGVIEAHDIFVTSRIETNFDDIYTSAFLRTRASSNHSKRGCNNWKSTPHRCSQSCGQYERSVASLKSKLRRSEERVASLTSDLKKSEKLNEKLVRDVSTFRGSLENMRDIVGSFSEWGTEIAFPLYQGLQRKCQVVIQNHKDEEYERDLQFKIQLDLHLAFWGLGSWLYPDPRENEDLKTQSSAVDPRELKLWAKLDLLDIVNTTCIDLKEAGDLEGEQDLCLLHQVTELLATSFCESN